MRTDLVSVIIPTYNRAHYVADALNSVQAQNRRPLEVVVVDDGSTDNTTAVVQTWIDEQADSGLRMILVEQSNAGAPAARNHGLRVSTGNWIKFLDSDDVLHPSCIERQMEASRSLADHEIVFGDLGRMDVSGENKCVEVTDPPSADTDMFAYLLDHVLVTPMPLHRRSLLEQVDGFREDIDKGQEYDLHLRLAIAGIRFVHEPGVAYYKRSEDTTPSTETISKSNSPLRNPEAHIFIQDNRHLLAQEYYNGDLPLHIQTTIARGYWVVGRQLTRAGYTERARYCFSRSQDLATEATDHIVGPRPYQWATRSIGPVAAERMLSTIKRCIGR